MISWRVPFTFNTEFTSNSLLPGMTRTFVTEQQSETSLDEVSVVTAVQKPVKPWEIRCLALCGSALGADSWLRSDVTVSALGSESFGIITWLNCVMSKLPLQSNPSLTADMLTTFKSILPNWAGEPFLIDFLRLSTEIGNDSIEIRKLTCFNMCIFSPLLWPLIKNSWKTQPTALTLFAFCTAATRTEIPACCKIIGGLLAKLTNIHVLGWFALGHENVHLTAFNSADIWSALWRKVLTGRLSTKWERSEYLWLKKCYS